MEKDPWGPTTGEPRWDPDMMAGTYYTSGTSVMRGADIDASATTGLTWANTHAAVAIKGAAYLATAAAALTMALAW